MKYQVISPVADVHGVPDTGALRGKFETQLVLGEVFTVHEEKNGWCKGVCAHDGYPGHIESRHLTKIVTPSTHIVTAARSHAYREATIKSPLTATLSFGSRIAVTSTAHQDYAQMSDGAWIYRKNITPIDALDKDPVATARKFLETPYYWGGRSGFGIDCSGLVQVVLARAGISALRDTEMQENVLGSAADTPRAGDIVYFQGHVGIMADDRDLIHANAFHMKVTVEPLNTVIARGKEITSIRRL
ncbi:MAG: C40 family peptidase [Pseudomonadota bacterium]